MKRLTDQELIAIIQAGDFSPAAEIYDRYSERIFNFSRRFLRNDALAAEATQEVFLRVLRSSNTFRTGSSVSTWMFSIAANYCRDHFRRSGVRGQMEPESALREVPAESTPELDAEQAWTAKLVDEALGILVPDQREAVLLFRYREMSHAEIAKVVGCSVTAVKARIFRAMDVMKRYLVDRTRTDSPAEEESAAAPAPAPVEETNV